MTQQLLGFLIATILDLSLSYGFHLETTSNGWFISGGAGVLGGAVI